VLIDEYFQQIEADIAQSIIVIHTELVKDKRSLYIGFVEGKLTFLDGSVLHFVEFANVKTGIDRYKYSYHYQDTNHQLIFRYDMAPHHKNVATFPHHKHTTSGQAIESTIPPLKNVLEEIEKLVT
jgi:hypothetical protein